MPRRPPVILPFVRLLLPARKSQWPSEISGANVDVVKRSHSPCYRRSVAS